jgi:hypothetical protein
VNTSEFPQELSSLDAEYRFGRPKVYLTPREQARLTILRSRLGETQSERQARAAGLAPEAPATHRRGRNVISIRTGSGLIAA